MSRQENLEEALKASEALLDLHLSLLSSLPFSVSEIEPEYENMLERRAKALAALREDTSTPSA